ncbi:AfsR/SARP family transcriptional regulator [Amycolatopsis sp. EV170708-02-1]|nr:AfsR/SARP family transcriptional regulator [Amycolatopsis sp. EV170708-02-1]UMP03717.1 AfsR/SARP family transcriptional regulator [Amycolatopsis sp. EV170708-02-1]
MINSNEVVSVDCCIDELWPTDPPKSALSTLQTYTLQLRKILRSIPPSAGATLELRTRHQGYQLVVPKECLDRELFDRQVEAAREELARDNVCRAATLFHSALRLCEEPVLADVRLGPSVAAYQLEIKETRFSVLGERIDADLRLGRHRAVIAELRQLTTSHPMDENIHAQLMVAHYRSGQRAESVMVFHRLRRTLAEDLGLEPSPQTKRLFEAILQTDTLRTMEAPDTLSGLRLA